MARDTNETPIELIPILEAAKRHYSSRAEYETHCEEMLTVAQGGTSAAVTNPELIELLRRAGQTTDIDDLADDLVEIADTVWGTDWDVRPRA